MAKLQRKAERKPEATVTGTRRTTTPVRVRDELLTRIGARFGTDYSNAELITMALEYILAGDTKGGGAEMRLPNMAARKQATGEIQAGEHREAPMKLVRKPSSTAGKYKALMDEESFDEFTDKEWAQYFQQKAKEHGMNYVIAHKIPAKAVLKSVVQNYKGHEIKRMIDFLYDSGQTTFDVTSGAINGLSKGWLDYTYTNSVLWVQGKFDDKKRKPQEIKVESTREWTSPKGFTSATKKGSVHI